MRAVSPDHEGVSGVVLHHAAVPHVGLVVLLLAADVNVAVHLQLGQQGGGLNQHTNCNAKLLK